MLLMAPTISGKSWKERDIEGKEIEGKIESRVENLWETYLRHGEEGKRELMEKCRDKDLCFFEAA